MEISLKKEFPKYRIGLSDHVAEREFNRFIVARSLGVTIIEKHFTIDKRLKGPDWEVSIEPDEMTQLCTSIKQLHKSVHNDYPEISQNELETRRWAKHGVYLREDITAGSVISMDKLIALRPVSDHSYRASQIPELIGRKINVNKIEGQPLDLSDVS